MGEAAVDERYARQELISWWDQSRLARANVVVVGAGALGNEIIKNLALLGVGRLRIYDLDRIERSNLARCVLFREEDEGRLKAEVAADAARRLNPEVQAVGEARDVRRLGRAAWSDADLILGGLDNREARLWVNQTARKLGKTWIDGAIEGLRGIVRVFPPTGACYECTLGERDRELLARRRSCSLLAPEEMEQGKTPTTATTASLVSAMQVQEAVKILAGRPELVALDNRALMYIGETMQVLDVVYTEDEDCFSHDRYEDIRPVPFTGDLTVEHLFSAAAAAGLGPEPVAEFEVEIVRESACDRCGIASVVLRRSIDLDPGWGRCASCGDPLRLDAVTTIAPGDPLAARPLVDLALPDGDIVTVRSGMERIHYVLEEA